MLHYFVRCVVRDVARRLVHAALVLVALRALTGWGLSPLPALARVTRNALAAGLR